MLWMLVKVRVCVVNEGGDEGDGDVSAKCRCATVWCRLFDWWQTRLLQPVSQRFVSLLATHWLAYCIWLSVWIHWLDLIDDKTDGDKVSAVATNRGLASERCVMCMVPWTHSSYKNRSFMLLPPVCTCGTNWQPLSATSLQLQTIQATAEDILIWRLVARHCHTVLICSTLEDCLLAKV